MFLPNVWASELSLERVYNYTFISMAFSINGAKKNVMCVLKGAQEEKRRRVQHGNGSTSEEHIVSKFQRIEGFDLFGPNVVINW